MSNKNSQEIFIGRQPILDRNGDLFAYELLFRSGQQNAAIVHDDLSATASVISHAFVELGVDQSLGQYGGFINCDASLLLSDTLEALPADRIVLEILETVEITPEIVARCAELKQRGFTLALDDFVSDTEKWRPLLDQVDIVKVDLLTLTREQLVETTEKLKAWPLKLLAEKVDSREQAEFCEALGYDFFQGYYFAKPAIIVGRKLGQSQLALLRLMSLIMQDAETDELEAAFKHEPGLSMNLLRLTNSVSTGLRVKVNSLRHAITVLGRRQLQRWLQIVLYTNPQGGNLVSPLMHLAATRGRLLELLAGKFKPGNREFEDRAFVCGIMSLMPTLMGAPLEEILRGIRLDVSVNDALTEHKGDLGKLLGMAEALETADGSGCALACAALGLSAEIVNACLSQAMAWASNIGSEADN